MFTGIVEAVGRLLSIEPRPFGVRLVVDAPALSRPPALGDSVSVAGCCLTLAAPPEPGRESARSLLAFDVVRETLSKTSLSRRTVGEGVNLETSCTPSTLLGGHLVQGHVDGVARVRRVQDDPQDWRVEIDLPPDLVQYASPKGSIAIEGVSLTIAALPPGGVEVALIPTTLERTTLHALREGDGVNVEMDSIAKIVVHWLRGRENA